jgi:Transglutaminase-like superfamily
MATLRRWLDLPRAEKRLFLAAFWWVVTYRLALWVLPLRFVLARSRRAGKPETGQFGPAEIGLVHQAVGRAARYMPRATCLTRALATHTLLGRRGIQTQLRIGVVKNASGQLLAHAWLERDGVKLVPTEEIDKYLPFPPIELLSSAGRS